MISDIIIGILAVVVPGFFLALALLKRTGMHLIEIFLIGIMFGIIFPPAMIWMEAYLIPYIHALSFSAGLYDFNVIILTLIGLLLSYREGALTTDLIPSFLRGGKASTAANITADYKQRISGLRSKISRLSIDMQIIREHEREELDLIKRHDSEMALLRERNAGTEETESVKRQHSVQERKLYEKHEREEESLISKEDARPKNKFPIAWTLLLLLMLLTFTSRIANIGVAPKFFEFDPYFDMMATQQILTYGYQLFTTHAAWPTLVNGTIQRIQPAVPYLEAYWYQLANHASASAQLNLNLLSNVSSIYPPLLAALLVFVVFMFVYHIYGDFPAIIAAGLAAAMPTLITTYIAGEQLLEPWGITTLFFFFAAYLLAVKNPKEKRYAILAGIAFISAFLGAHYYTVAAGILALYIVIQGIIDVLRKRSMTDFYKMNAVVLIVIIIGYAVYQPYNAVYGGGIPSFIGIPTIVLFPLAALVLVAVFEYGPILAKKYNITKSITALTYYEWLALLVIIVLVAILFTPLGKPVSGYINLSKRFTTPSSPLFMTVQEYAPTGATYNFGSNGFGIIAVNIFGFPLILWLVLIAFAIIEIYNIIINDSKTSILSLWVVAGLAVAGMSEVKYLPHFGVAYLIAVAIIIGEIALYIKRNGLGSNAMYVLYGVAAIIVLIEATSIISVFSAAANPNCNVLSSANNTNNIGLTMFCNQVPQAWLSAMAWASQNIGPHGPRILAWWDYGDWINWFGNSNAAIRGDNAVASFDYAVAAQYVMGINSSFGPSTLASFMNKNTTQAGYVLFDDQLVPKWSALDFLACINQNQTSQSFAEAQGAKYGANFLTGTSQCELTHDPVSIDIPYNPSISNYCSLPNSSVTTVKSVLTAGETVPEVLNQTYCVGTTANSHGVISVYTTNGMKTNIIVEASSEFYNGEVQLQQNGPIYLSFMALYLPNGPNDTVTNAPTYFYNSNYYRGFFFGKLSKAFTLVYPSNFTGINFVNSTNSVMIFKLNNYTATLPAETPKPSWISNNYLIPG